MLTSLSFFENKTATTATTINNRWGEGRTFRRFPYSSSNSLKRPRFLLLLYLRSSARVFVFMPPMPERVLRLWTLPLGTCSLWCSICVSNCPIGLFFAHFWLGFVVWSWFEGSTMVDAASYSWASIWHSLLFC